MLPLVLEWRGQGKRRERERKKKGKGIGFVRKSLRHLSEPVI